MKTLGAPRELLDVLRAECEKLDLPFKVVDGDDADVVLCNDDGQRRDCSAKVLYRGGRITCAAAFELAGRLDISVRNTGKLLDGLNIRIKSCQLGCFS